MTINNAQPSDAGSYTVTITNMAGSTTSAEATLTLTNPVISLSVVHSAAMTTNGFTFQLSIPVGLTYVISASTNLQDWTPIFTNIADTETITLIDTDAINYKRRLYRATVPQ